MDILGIIIIYGIIAPIAAAVGATLRWLTGRR